jgi:hypothetical protein
MKNMIVFIFILSGPLYASGTSDQQMEYVDLGKIQIQIIGTEGLPGNINYSPFIIPLPYIKPKGVNRVPVKDLLSIIVEKLMVDGKEIKRKRLFSEKMFVDSKNYENASEEEEEHIMVMRWFIKRDEKDKTKILGLHFYSETGNTLKREEYIIPYGSKELFLTYKIRFPLYTDSNDIVFFHTESQLVKCLFVWSEARE